MVDKDNNYGVKFVISILCVGLLVSFSSHAAPPKKQRHDPLIGQIIDPKSRQPISFEAMVDRIVPSDVIYLGEKHDNVQHHDQQVHLLQTLVEKGIRPAIGFEFFNVGQTAYLMQYVDHKSKILNLGHGQKKIDPETRLRKQLGWQDSEDQDWQFYFQLIELARQHQLEVFGADISRGLALRISRAGISSLTGTEKGLLETSEFEDPAYRETMYATFKASHCGWGEEPHLTYLYQTWLARNLRMARSIIQTRETDPGRPVMLIVGNGHVEYNRGVVEQVARLSPGVNQLNLGMWEISTTPQPLSAYLETEEGDENLSDLLWFTQRHDYNDPCAAFKGISINAPFPR